MILQRFLQMIVVLLLLSFVTFLLMRLAPGDPVKELLRADEMTVTIEEEQQLREKLGFDQPLLVQYGHWFFNVLRFDFGQSYISNESVITEIINHLPATIIVTIGSLIVMIMISVPLGILSALHQNGWIDHLGRIVALIGASIPTFWLALLFIQFFSVKLSLFPTMGGDGFIHYILPSVTLGIAMAAIYARLIRSTLLDSLQKPYVQMAEFRGLKKNTILFRYALRESLLPILSLLSMTVSSLLGGTVVIEVIFSLPGLGRLIIDAIMQRDYPLIQGYVLLIGVLVIVLNLVVDLLQYMLNPYMRLKEEK